MSKYGDGEIAGDLFDPRLSPQPVPTVGVFDAPTVCIPINVQWIPFISGVIERLAWGEIWSGDDDDKTFAIQEIYSLVEAMLQGRCMIIRQNPDNSCQLQYSIDGGETWILGFDYSLCISPLDYIEQVSEAGQSNAELITLYDGYIPNIAPNFEYDGSLLDAQRDAALCLLVSEFIDQCCESAIEIINAENQTLEDEASIFKLVTGGLQSIAQLLAEIKVYPVASAFAAIGLSFADVLLDLYVEIQTKDISTFQDDDAKEIVLCAIMSNIVDQTPTFTSWTSSASASLTGNAEDIREVVYAAMQDEVLFVRFFDMFDETVGAISAENCPCSLPAANIHVSFDVLSGGGWEFDYSDANYAPANEPQSNDEGNPVPAFECGFIDYGSSKGHTVTVWVELDSAVTVESVSLDYAYYLETRSAAILRSIALFDVRGGTIQDSYSVSSSPSEQSWHNELWTPTTPVTGISAVRFTVGWTVPTTYNDVTASNSYTFIDNLRITPL